MAGLFELFRSFLKIGAFTFGGGYAMIPLIEREVIDRKGWIGRQEFLDLLTIAQSAPGPISLNTSVFVGYKLRGYTGAIASILGVVLPSFSIILAVALFFSGIRDNAAISLARGMHRALYLVIAASALAIWHLGWSPVYILLAAALAGIGWELRTLKRRAK